MCSVGISRRCPIGGRDGCSCGSICCHRTNRNCRKASQTHASFALGTSESRMRFFADDIGIDFDELDLALWSMKTGEVLK